MTEARPAPKPTTYVSRACLTRLHARCGETDRHGATPPTSTGYEPCACDCHNRGRRGPRTEVASFAVIPATIQRGDVIQIGGQPCRVKDIVRLPGRARRLIFSSGETLSVHARTRLVVFRTVRRS